MNLPEQIQIREVGPRDGLQAEPEFMATENKIALINQLFQAGFKMMEATSFVNPKAIPQLRDAEQVVKGINRSAEITVSALVGNIRGVKRALMAGADEVQVVISASEEHNRRNVNMSIRQSLIQLEEVVPQAQQSNLVVRAAIATAFGCPFEGEIPLKKILGLINNFQQLGIKQVTLADTAGLGDPLLVTKIIQGVREGYPQIELALHFHDTRGLGLANALAGLQSGVTILEASLGGLGGCPFIPRATGNIATEDLVFMVERMGIQTGIDLTKILTTARWLENLVGHELPGKVLKAGISGGCFVD
ncbi:MAG: hydroxymethylglutaryl-CoA lyase [Syntrophomonadaceae bacterium]|nr:hydroxymethylglutaryl-CoA lyase [Syntrophomonadaceae bacterium]